MGLIEAFTVEPAAKAAQTNHLDKTTAKYTLDNNILDRWFRICNCEKSNFGHHL
jgi:hypothetical protein